jgi:hypothetical protein
MNTCDICENDGRCTRGQCPCSLSGWFITDVTKDVANDLLLRHERLKLQARQVMKYLEEHGPAIVPHLLDTDDNPGQRLRELLQCE